MTESPENPSQKVQWHLRLYVAGKTPSALAAVDAVTKFVEQLPGSKAVLEIWDINDHPVHVESDDIASAPALIRLLPEPRQVVTGPFESVTALRARLAVGI